MDIRQKARQLRVNSTDAEYRLWRQIRNRQLKGCKFRRQMPVDHYIVDFVCAELKLIIEIDGGQHAEARLYDAERTEYLQSKEYQVVRFWNNEVLGNTDGVLERIAEILAQRKKELDAPSP
jgi:very-short-patch-repair endonuclease